MIAQIPKITVWRVIFAAIMLSGLYATYLRIFYGLGGSTNLSDQFPWGIWIGFDVMCGVGLAAGGFTLVAIVHIFNIEKIQAGAAAGDPDGVPRLHAGGGRAAVRPGPARPPVASAGDVESALGDVRSGLVRHPLHHGAVPGIPAGGVREVRLAQAARVDPPDLGAADDPGRAALHPAPELAGHPVPDRARRSCIRCGIRPILPLLFYVSAIAVGLAMTIFESWHSSRAFGRALELPLLASMARVLAVVHERVPVDPLPGSEPPRMLFGLLTQNRIETWLFALEIALMVVPDRAALSSAQVRMRPGALYACAVMVVFGFIANRLNVGTTGWKPARGTHYIPKWSEMAVTLSIVAAGLRHLPRRRRLLPHFRSALARAARRREDGRNGGGPGRGRMTPTRQNPVGTGRQARGLRDREHGGLFRFVRLHQPADASAATPRTWSSSRPTHHRHHPAQHALRDAAQRPRGAASHVIQEIGSEPGIQRIRIFNKEGRITFSTDRASESSASRRTCRRLPRAVAPHR